MGNKNESNMEKDNADCFHNTNYNHHFNIRN